MNAKRCAGCGLPIMDAVGPRGAVLVDANPITTDGLVLVLDDKGMRIEDQQAYRVHVCKGTEQRKPGGGM